MPYRFQSNALCPGLKPGGMPSVRARMPSCLKTPQLIPDAHFGNNTCSDSKNRRIRCRCRRRWVYHCGASEKVMMMDNEGEEKAEGRFYGLLVGTADVVQITSDILYLSQQSKCQTSESTGHGMFSLPS